MRVGVRTARAQRDGDRAAIGTRARPIAKQYRRIAACVCARGLHALQRTVLQLYYSMCVLRSTVVVHSEEMSTYM